MEPNKLSVHFLCAPTEESLELGANDVPWEQKLNVKGYNSTEELLETWIRNLRMVSYQHINFEKENSKAKIHCIFSSDCKKTLCGKGNLRRHLEWHLMRIEDACWKRKDRLFGINQQGGITKVPESMVMLQLTKQSYRCG
jgi:hypothetical protein